jgi:hypothetical protein
MKVMKYAVLTSSLFQYQTFRIYAVTFAGMSIGKLQMAPFSLSFAQYRHADTLELDSRIINWSGNQTSSVSSHQHEIHRPSARVNQA